MITSKKDRGVYIRALQEIAQKVQAGSLSKYAAMEQRGQALKTLQGERNEESTR